MARASEPVACSATGRAYAESTQVLRTRRHSADPIRYERPGQRPHDVTVELAKPLLDVEAVLGDVAVDEFVLFAFNPEFADVFGLGP